MSTNCFPLFLASDLLGAPSVHIDASNPSNPDEAAHRLSSKSPNFGSEPLFTVPDYDPGLPSQAMPPNSSAPRPSAASNTISSTTISFGLDERGIQGKGSGGKSKCCTKDWERKVGSKHTGCPCWLTIKSYPGTSEVLDFYKSEHTHAIGDENLKYMRLDSETCKEIEMLLRLRVEPKKVLETITKNLYQESKIDTTRSRNGHQRDFATRADDGPSVLEWAEKLRDEGHFVSLKRSDESAPPESKLNNTSFVLIIQTKYQQECWQKYGSKFAGINGTHNTTHYENMTLFTLLVRDKWGHVKGRIILKLDEAF
ncbi:hypothetical protein C8R43DRAFT_954386 [Mycena crocata]|nr:hypothetical protein C8R43DRAFT_954386 [Mycena crocata]